MARDRQQSVVEKSHSESKHQERDLCNSRVCNLVLLALPRHDEPCSRAPQLALHKTSRSRRLPAAAQLGGRAVPPLRPVVLLRCRDLSCGFPWERLVQANIALLPGGCGETAAPNFLPSFCIWGKTLIWKILTSVLIGFHPPLWIIQRLG